MLPFPSTITTPQQASDKKPKQYTKLLTYPPNSSNTINNSQRSTREAGSSGSAGSSVSSLSTCSSSSSIHATTNNPAILSLGSSVPSAVEALNTSNSITGNNTRVSTITSNNLSTVILNEKAQPSKVESKPTKQAAKRSQQIQQGLSNGIASSSSASKKVSPTATTSSLKRAEPPRLSSDSALSVDIEASKKKKRKVIEDDSPDMNTYFQTTDESNTNTNTTFPQVYFAPPVFQYDYYSYPQMMAVPQYGTQAATVSAPSPSVTTSTPATTQQKHVETDEEYAKRRPIIAQYLEKKLGFTRYVLDRLDDRELSHQFIHSLTTSKDRSMMGSLCMSLLSSYLQEIKSVQVSDLTFQDATNQNGSVHFNLMGASIEYSALISRILVMTCDPDYKSNKVADLLALSFMLIFNFGSYCRSGCGVPTQ